MHVASIGFDSRSRLTYSWLKIIAGQLYRLESVVQLGLSLRTAHLFVRYVNAIVILGRDLCNTLGSWRKLGQRQAYQIDYGSQSKRMIGTHLGEVPKEILKRWEGRRSRGRREGEEEEEENRTDCTHILKLV